MSNVRTSHSVFRFRCYKMPDGTIKEVFGDEPAPVGAEWFLEDVIVDQTTIKTSNLDGAVKLDQSGTDAPTS